MDEREREAAAWAIAREARDKVKTPQRMNVVVGTGTIVIVALVWMRSGLNSSAFGVGLLLGVGVGLVAGLALGARQRHSSRKTP